MPIEYFVEKVDFNPGSTENINRWIKDCIESEGHFLNQLSYIFCSDNYLLEINQQYLDHHDFTDIITFDHSEDENEISGDLFISIDRIKDNSSAHKSDFSDELHRVMIHGVLHLLGYGDKTDLESAEIRKKEDHYLYLRSF